MWGLVGNTWVICMCFRERHGPRGLCGPRTPDPQGAGVVRRVRTHPENGIMGDRTAQRAPTFTPGYRAIGPQPRRLNRET